MAIDSKSRLRGSFADVLQRQAAELAQLARDAAADPDIQDALQFELERIRGTAQSLGVASVDRAAQVAMEAALEGGNVIEQVDRLVDACRALEGLEPVFRPVVLLVNQVTLDLDEFAADLRVASSVQEALDLVVEVEPGAVVVDLLHLGELLGRLEGKARSIPLYVTGPKEELTQRVNAFRMGAAGYLDEPLKVDQILSLVRSRMAEADPPPYRILLVEPDETQARQVLQGVDGAGRVLKWVKTADEFLPALESFHPELLVLATELGTTSGMDLASVVRNHERWHDLPMLFLAGEAAVETTGFVTTADDVLIKPVPAVIVRSRVLARLGRFRRYRRQLEVDPLTRVLNRGALLRAADREVRLARRAGQPMSVVLVDLDGMAALNAAMGLEAGDRALVEAARLMAAAVRETDVVGRLGGDTFGILMTKCAAVDARKRVEAFREQFRTWAQQGGFGDLDFSAGIADTGTTFRDVLSRADRALLEARHAGGSRSQLAR